MLDRLCAFQNQKYVCKEKRGEIRKRDKKRKERERKIKKKKERRKHD